MNQELYDQFLVIVPEKQHIIKDCPEITRYIHKFIVSKPCETLVEEIEKDHCQENHLRYPHQRQPGSVSIQLRP